MEIVTPPAVVAKPEQHVAGIRVVTPFRGMFAVRDRLMQQLYDAGVGDGRTFFRLRVVNMDGPMDIEVGIETPGPIAPVGPISPGVLPAGNYATMTYVNHGRRANGALIDWIRGNGLAMDVVENPAGDQFGCRYEMYLTDPRSERMKTKWQTELAIRLAD